jgi:hypothetical protein
MRFNIVLDVPQCLLRTVRLWQLAFPYCLSLFLGRMLTRPDQAINYKEIYKTAHLYVFVFVRELSTTPNDLSRRSSTA